MTALRDATKRAPSFWTDLWFGLSVRGLLLVAAIFVGYEVVERLLLHQSSLATLHRLHILRGVSSSFILATWAFMGIRRARLDRDRDLERMLRELELRVEERTREMREAETIAREQERLASLGVLAAGIAHDLGNPLTSLSSELEMLEVEDDPNRLRESLAVLRRHVDRMARSLRDIVGFARRRGDEVSDVVLTEAINDAIRLVAHGPNRRKLRISVELPSDMPPVRMVEDQLVMVLVNLLINAAEAMSEGGVVRVRARADAEWAVLSVEDEGAGMSPAVLAQARRPLFTTKAARGGSGLGLWGSERVLAAVGGAIAISSEEGRGTTVTLRLPLAQVRDEETHDPRGLAAGAWA